MSKRNRKWRVEYDLLYDMGGSGPWMGYYRTRLGAEIARFYNLRLGSWGGSAIIYYNRFTKRS